MNFNEIITVWQDYDRKLNASRIINEKIIRSMMREKSGSTLARMRRMCLFTIGLMLLIICFCTLSILYNAFDFEFSLQFLPLVIYILVAGLFILYLIRTYRGTQVDLYNDHLRGSLLKVIAVQEKFMAIHNKLVLVFFTAGFLYLFSASLVVFQNKGAVQGALALLVGTAITLGIYYGARQMGAFKDHYGIQLKNQLRELEEFDVG